jgi:hypothetical protein
MEENIPDDLRNLGAAFVIAPHAKTLEKSRLLATARLIRSQVCDRMTDL